MKKTGRPNLAADVLKSTIGNFRLAQKFKEYSSFARWKEIVGEELAQVSSPLRIIRHTVLEVRVDDDAYGQELSMHKEEILDKILTSGFSNIINNVIFVTKRKESS